MINMQNINEAYEKNAEKQGCAYRFVIDMQSPKN